MKNRGLLSSLDACLIPGLVWKASASRWWCWEAWLEGLGAAALQRCICLLVQRHRASLGNNGALCLADVKAVLAFFSWGQLKHSDLICTRASASQVTSNLAKVMQRVRDAVRDRWKSLCSCFSLMVPAQHLQQGMTCWWFILAVLCSVGFISVTVGTVCVSCTSEEQEVYLTQSKIRSLTQGSWQWTIQKVMVTYDLSPDFMEWGGTGASPHLLGRRRCISQAQCRITGRSGGKWQESPQIFAILCHWTLSWAVKDTNLQKPGLATAGLA